MRFIAIAIIFTTFTCSAQFDGAGGELGSKSIDKDNSSITAWATSAVIQRGKLQINQSNNSLATLGDSSSAIGPFDGNVLSLGDSGVVTLGFDEPIINSEGYDFAVFENGFRVGFSYYLELAHVEVSDNGTDFVRFPSESLSDTSYQTDNFGYTDPVKLKNLAGKHQAPYGTLFDLEEIGLDQINYIRIVDVIGSVNDSFGTRDSKGRI
ncbi:MAG: T9SS C-terminal target domain-containing protein, partial [Bacteroidota bacterium]